MTWQFTNHGARRGSFNMQFDEAMADELAAGQRSPTLRLYAWDPPAISLGYHQNPEDFDMDALFGAGIDLVRRPTGGRAILHDRELTYSLVAFLDDNGPRALYRSVNVCLLAGLKFLGIDAELSGSQPDFRALYAEQTSIPCFASSAKDEIQYRGKKLVGSAQRRLGTVILQHGSLLLGPQHREIVRFLAPHARSAGESMEATLRDHTVDAATILGREVSFDEAAAAIRKGFETGWGISFTETTPSPGAELKHQITI
jgi:lipoyl(octanoyl) transferase